MGKRIGIVSYNINCNFTNYGSALQSWALSESIKKLGHHPILIDYCPDILRDKDPLNPIKNMWDTDEESRHMCELSLPAIRINYKKFENFYSQRFSRTQTKYFSHNFDSVVADEQLDGFVCGSDTIFCIDEFGFDRMGAGFDYEEVYRVKLLQINGLKIGLINLCEAQLGQFKEKGQKYGYAWIGDFDVDERIRMLRKEVDYLVLIPHAGLENYSVPLQQFRYLYHHWCDVGVDVIVGGHPHISQGIEQYGNSTIFYSLGNFFFTGFNGEIDTWTKGISCVLHFDEQGFSYDLIQHRMNDTVVTLVKDDINEIRIKNSIFSDEERYKFILKEQNAIAFKDLNLRLYMSALNGTSDKDSFITKCKKIIYYLLNYRLLYAESEYYRMSVLKRLAENETYRFLTISAIEDLLGENNHRL